MELILLRYATFLLLLSVRVVNALLGWGRTQGGNSPGVSVALKRRI